MGEGDCTFYCEEIPEYEVQLEQRHQGTIHEYETYIYQSNYIHFLIDWALTCFHIKLYRRQCGSVSGCTGWWLSTLQRGREGGDILQVCVYLFKANAARCQVEEEDEAICRVAILLNDNTK